MLNDSMGSVFWKICSMTTGAIERIYLPKKLGASVVGDIDLIGGKALILYVISSLGFNFYIPKVLPTEYRDRPREILKKVYSISLFSLVSISPVVWLFSIYIVDESVSLPSFLASMALASMYISADLLFYYFTSQEHATKASFLFFLVRSIRLLNMIFLFMIWEKSARAYLGAVIFTYFAVVLYFGRKDLRVGIPDFSMMDKMKYFFFLSITQNIYPGLGRMLQGKYYDSESVFLLANAGYIVEFMALFGYMFAFSASPIFSSHFKNNQIEKSKVHFRELVRLALMATIPFVIFVIFNASEIMELGANEKIGGAGSMLIVLSLIPILRIFTLIGGALLTMSGYEKVEITNNIVRLISYLVFANILGSRYIYGISLALLLSDVALFVMVALELRSYFSLNILSPKELAFLLSITIVETYLCYLFFRFEGLKLLYMGLIFLSLSLSISLPLSPFNDFKKLIGRFGS